MSDKKPTTSFVLASNILERSTIWPCTLRMPMDDGKKVELAVSAKFKSMPPEEYAAVTNGFIPGLDTDVVVLKRVLVGFAGLQDENRNAVPDDKALETMLSLPWAVRGLAAGYLDMVSNRLPGN